MKNNKKMDIRDVYYATTHEQNNIPNYVIVVLKDGGLVDIKTGEKYTLNKGQGIYNSTNTIKLSGMKPYCHVIKKCMFGTITSEELLENDKFVSKVYDEKEEKFIFNNNNEMQETLAIIKPDGVKHATEIIEMFYKEDLKIKKYEVKRLDEEILREHYSHLVDKPFYPKLEEYMLSGEVILMVLEGINAVQKLRNIMGPTDSKKAPIGTIRGNFGTDITYNAIHGSDSVLSALDEINRFFGQKQKRI